MHEHEECEHKNLKHCSKCDVVYCEDCKKEWIKQFVTIYGSSTTISNSISPDWTYVNCGTCQH